MRWEEDVDLRSKKRYEIIISENRKINLLGCAVKIHDQKFLMSPRHPGYVMFPRNVWPPKLSGIGIGRKLNLTELEFFQVTRRRKSETRELRTFSKVGLFYWTQGI